MSAQPRLLLDGQGDELADGLLEGGEVAGVLQLGEAHVHGRAAHDALEAALGPERRLLDVGVPGLDVHALGQQKRQTQQRPRARVALVALGPPDGGLGNEVVDELRVTLEQPDELHTVLELVHAGERGGAQQLVGVLAARDAGPVTKSSTTD